MTTYEKAFEVLLPKVVGLKLTGQIIHTMPQGEEDWVVEVQLSGDEDNTCVLDYVDLALYGSPLDHRFVWWYKGIEGKYCLTDKEILREHKKLVAKSMEAYVD